MADVREVANAPSVSPGKADWSDLRVFHAVAQTGSLNAAAKALGLTQPTVSQRIRDLEIRLGATVLIRSPQGVALTEAGKMLAERVSSMAHTVAGIEELLQGFDHEERGRVGLTAPDGVAGYWLAAALPNFQRQFPEIQVSVDCGLWKDMPPRLQPDIFIGFNEAASSDMDVRPLAFFHYALFASRDYIETYGQPKTLNDMLANHRVAMHVAQIHQPDGWRQPVNAIHQLSPATVETNCSTVLLRIIKNGGGIGALPTAMVEQEPDLVMLDLPPISRATLWMRHRYDVGRRGRVRRVTDWLREVFDTTHRPWFREEFVHPSQF